jgi:hypothetical protein
LGRIVVTTPELYGKGKPSQHAALLRSLRLQPEECRVVR